MFNISKLFTIARNTDYILEIDLLNSDLYLGFSLEVKLLWFLIAFLLLIIILLSIDKVLKRNQISDLSQQLVKQIDSIIAAEKKTLELQTELEHRVIKRTAALGLANQDLKENTIWMEKVANLTPNILYIYDLEKKYNVYSNRFVGEVLGYSVAEIEEMNIQLFNKLLHPDDRDLVTAHHQRCLTLGQDEYLELEYRMKDRYGRWHWLHSKDTVFERDEKGTPTQILGVTQDITETKKIQLESIQLTLQLEEKIATLETWREGRMRLGQMNEFLQACLSIPEAESVLTDLLPKLFPRTHGAVYLMNNSKNLLNAIAVWGLANSSGSFEPNDCWALRRSRAHLVNSTVSGLHCTHIEHQKTSTPTLCQPMIAKGKTLGMLYLRFDDSTVISELVEELTITVAQNIAMSFANLKLQEKLRYQSLRDPLTGLFNRRYLQESLSKEIERAYRKQHFIGVMMLDIDHFKRFNDTYGHSTGDLVLQQVATYLMSEIRQYDIACRYGGEELVLVMLDADIGDIVIRAEAIRVGVSKLKLEHEGKKLESISVSIGISCFPDDGNNVDSLISTADKALYQAKKDGRNCVKRC